MENCDMKVKVNDRGQITLPKYFRDLLGITADSNVKLVYNPEEGLQIQMVSIEEDMEDVIREKLQKKNIPAVEFEKAVEIEKKRVAESFLKEIEQSIQDCKDGRSRSFSEIKAELEREESGSM